MIGNVSPGEVNCEYTLNTLRYADWVKELKNDKVKKRDELMLPWNRLSKATGKTAANSILDNNSANENLSMFNKQKLPEIASHSSKKSVSLSKEQRSKRILPIFSKFQETPQSENSSF